MLTLTLRPSERTSFKILALGAHADDIEIGCGGTILRLAEAYPECEIDWVVLSANGERANEARRSADAFLQRAGKRTVMIQGFRDGFLPYSASEVKDFFEWLKGEVSPELILTHQWKDLHQDHRLVSELTWNTFRDHLILEYEIPKYDGDLGSPNVFVHLSESIVESKLQNILAHFSSQSDRRWFTNDIFLSTLRLRGMESNSPSRYAEGFYGRKLVL